MHSKSLCTMVVLAQNSCIITNMHHHIMHYDQVNCSIIIRLFLHLLDLLEVRAFIALILIFAY